MSHVMKAAGNLVAALFESVEETLRNVSEKRQDTADRVPDIPVDAQEVPELTYRDVVSWVTRNRPKDERVARAAVLRESSRRGYRVTTVFLDRDGKIVHGEQDLPYGRAQRVRKLDNELQDFFGKQDMVVFE